MSSEERLRWEWTLVNGARISAELEPKSGQQEVRQGARLLAEATSALLKTHDIDAAGEGDDKEPMKATVTFDPRGPFCILKVDGFEVSPRVWPPPSRRSSVVARPSLPVGSWLVAGAILVVALGSFAFYWSRRDAGSAAALDTSYRAPSGLFVAHYPKAMKLTKATLGAPLSGITLADDGFRETIVIAALRLEDDPGQDGWSLHQKLGAELLANVPKTAAYQERERRDESCFGGPGGAVVGAMGGAPAMRVWSCAAVRDGRGYLVTISLPEPAVDLGRLRAIAEATELTSLAPLE